MAKYYNLARVTTATTGTGTITLGAAVSGYLTFALAGVSDGDSVDYAISDGANSEIGTGTYTASGTTLTRSVTKSTNSNSAISLSGSAQVFITPRAESLVDATLLTSGTLPAARLPSTAALLTGTPSANQFATWNSSTTLQGVTITGLVKGNGASAPAAATAGTDYLAPPSGTSILKANSGGALANATAGTDYCAATSGSSVLKGSSGNTTAATAGTDYMKPDTTSALSAGFTATSYSGGTVTGSGQTYTPSAANGNYQHITLNGSSLTGTFTFAAPSSVTSIVVEVVNGGSGAVGATLSTSGYTKVTGDTYATTNGNRYNFCITKTQNYSHLHIQALQ